MQNGMTNLELRMRLRKLMENQKKQAERIATLEALLAEKPKLATRKKPGSSELELPEEWNYPTITAEIARAVVSNNGLQAAANSLDMDKKELELLLKLSGIVHTYNEKWRVTMRRALGYIAVPEDWHERLEEILEKVRETNLKETAEWLETGRTALLGRFLWDNGYDTIGQPLKKKKC